MTRNIMTIVDIADGWKEARIGDRTVVKFKPPAGATLLELHAFAEHLLKLAGQRAHGPS